MMRLALFSSGGEPLGSLALAVPALEATPRGGAQTGADHKATWYAVKTTLPTLPGSASCEVSLRIWFEGASYGPMSPLQYSEVVPWESLLDLDRGRAPPGLGDRLLQYLKREPEIEWLLDCGCRDGLLAEVMVYALPCLLEILQGGEATPAHMAQVLIVLGQLATAATGTGQTDISPRGADSIPEEGLFGLEDKVLRQAL